MAEQRTFGYRAMSAMRPELKQLHSPDVFELDNPTLDQSGPFCVLVQAMFGPEGEEGEESFDVLVCNPKWVEQQSRIGTFNSRHHLIVSKFDASEIRAFLIEAASHCSGQTWDEVASKLGRIGKWEFEDYVE